MKKIISILITLILIFALFCVPASAAGTGTLALSNAEGKQGDTVTVNVNLNSNPGLITMKFTVSWIQALSLQEYLTQVSSQVGQHLRLPLAPPTPFVGRIHSQLPTILKQAKLQH